MSNSLAIAAVTTTLQNVLFSGLRGVLGSGNITTLPLDKARGNSDSNQINLFLYHAQPNPAWQNRPKRTQVKRGTSDEPPLGLDLYYLIAAYGKDDDEIASHQLLGRVMSLFHDRKILHAADILTATAKRLPESDLHEQIDSINITPQALSFEEISKIWQGFQAQYRASVAYQISVVTLDSQLPVNVPLPVLPERNGGTGGGRRLFSNLGIPALKSIQLPNGQHSAQFGDVLTLRGSLLNRPQLSVQLAHPLLGEPIALSPLPEATEAELQVRLSDRAEDPSFVSRWVAGFYTLSLVCHREEYEQRSEALSLAIAPQVAGLASQQEGEGFCRIEVACYPQVRPGQQVVLLLGARGIALAEDITVPEDASAPSRLAFRARNVPAGVYVVRLRVDGVDSIPVDFSTQPDVFSERISI